MHLNSTKPQTLTFIQSSRIRYGCHECEFVNRKTGKVIQEYSPVDSRRMARAKRHMIAKTLDLKVTDIEIRIIHRAKPLRYL